MIKLPYTTPEERTALIDDYVTAQGKHIIEEHRHLVGNFIVFDDMPTPETDEEINRREYRKLPLASITPEQVDSYIDNNVTDLESAKDVLKMFGKVLIRLARKSGM